MKILTKIKTIGSIFLALSVISSHALDAPTALVPTGLKTGEEFYIIFITSTTRDATSADIADYNSHVNTAADMSNLKGTDDNSLTWQAVVATSEADQCDPYSGDDTDTAIYSTKGDKIANNRNDMLDGDIDKSIIYDETGTYLSRFIWTGCNNGGYGNPLYLLGGPGMYSFIGNSKDTGAGWLSVRLNTKSNLHHLYAVSEKLTVAIP